MKQEPKQTIVYPGAQIGELKVIMSVRTPSGETKRWRCECSCGERLTIRQNYLTRPNPKSDCGGIAHASDKTKYKREYGIWTMMQVRTSDPRHVSYKDYGGRGIKVDAEWLNNPGTGYDGFARFLKDMKPAPTQKHTLDRIDPDSNYGPGKCRWATMKEQARNKRSDKVRAERYAKAKANQTGQASQLNQPTKGESDAT